MIKRNEYLTILQQLKDQNLIKVITGIRRCGKSTLLDQFRNWLLENGVDQSQIISFNFEDDENEHLLDRHVLSRVIREKMTEKQMYYIFLDEVQNVVEFEKLVDSLFVKDNTDVYITGSNAYLLSSELATFLSGRYIETNVLPFSFKEYYLSGGMANVDGLPDMAAALEAYLHDSSFPQAVTLGRAAPERVAGYVKDIYQTVLVKDILKRRAIKYPRAFDQVTRFTLDSIGSLVSPHSIAKSLFNNADTNKTVESYLRALVDSYVFYPVSRFDIKGKQHLRTLEKYYVVDLGLRQALIGKTKESDLGHLLENVVYLELLRRGGTVYLGKIGEREVDFVVQSHEGNISYYQVAYTVKSEGTLARELAALKSIRDHNPKYLLTTDPLSFDEDGIKHINVARWLLGE